MGAVFIDVHDDIIKEASKTMTNDFVFIFPFTKQETAERFVAALWVPALG